MIFLFLLEPFPLFPFDSTSPPLPLTPLVTRPPLSLPLFRFLLTLYFFLIFLLCNLIILSYFYSFLLLLLLLLLIFLNPPLPLSPFLLSFHRHSILPCPSRPLLLILHFLSFFPLSSLSPVLLSLSLTFCSLCSSSPSSSSLPLPRFLHPRLSHPPFRCSSFSSHQTPSSSFPFSSSTYFPPRTH